MISKLMRNRGDDLGIFRCYQRRPYTLVKHQPSLVLAIHGFGATPHTTPFQVLTETKGKQYKAPTLFQKNGQADVSFNDDLKQIFHHIGKSDVKDIWAHSAGALLALEAAKKCEMDTILLINPFIKPYQPHFNFTCKIFKWLPKTILKKMFVPNGPIPDDQKGWWLDRSFWSVIKLNDLRKATMADLKIVGNPKVIIIQAVDDRTSHPDSAEILKHKIYEKNPHLKVDVFMISGGHQITQQCLSLLKEM